MSVYLESNVSSRRVIIKYTGIDCRGLESKKLDMLHMDGCYLRFIRCHGPCYFYVNYYFEKRECVSESHREYIPTDGQVKT